MYAQHDSADVFAREARAAGVERIVLLSSASVLLPWAAANVITRRHRQVEETFIAAELPFVPVRPLVLATNALFWAESVRAGGPLPLYRPGAVNAPVHERDIAAVAVAALSGRRDDEVVRGMLTGPDALTQEDQVTVISQAIGREVGIQELTRRQAADRYGDPDDAEETEAVLQFIDDAAQGNSPTTTVAELVLGRPALPFSTWVGDHLADFT